MSSPSAMTATKGELIREIAKARAQAAAAVTRALEANERATRIEEEAGRRLNIERARRRRKEVTKRAELRRIKDQRELMTRLIELQVAVDKTPTDPNAHQHCLDLLAALKEKN